jgi:hypothetical protein
VLTLRGGAVSKLDKLWRADPTDEDWGGALSYLRLVYGTAGARRLEQALRKSRTVRHTAKDLLRASALPLLPCDESHVEEDLKKLRKGKALSPVLLIQGDMSRGIPLVIADGYHRVCALCYFDEDAPIACRITQGSASTRRPT